MEDDLKKIQKRNEEFKKEQEERARLYEIEKAKKMELQRQKEEKQAMEQKRKYDIIMKEERIKKEEEEKKKKEEEENKAKEAKEGADKIKSGYLNKLNKKEEELNEEEKKRLEDIITYEKMIDDYNNSTFREPTENTEGRNIKYTFEEINQISTEPLNNLEITKSGKIITLSNKELSKITIYAEKTFEEEDCIVLESKVNSIIVKDDNIYCALDEPEENILIMSLKDSEEKIYLVGHTCSVTDLTLTKYGYLVSSDIEGNIIVWKDNEIKKRGNDFHSYINTISETKNNTQGIAILSFKEELIKFYDLRYSTLECIETITNIKGSGLKNNMLKLNENILAVSGTYIYIIDLNALIVTNMINCVYANDCISNFHFNDKGFFFVSQALTHSWTDELEKGILAYYQYNFNDPIYPDVNTLVKLASKPNSHDHFICSIKQVDSKTIVTGGFDGKIKFWVLNEIN
jgi:WD40 repeat protein